MTIDLSAITPNQIVWAVIIVICVVLAVVVIRFFWTHILRYLFHGCLVILVIAALLFLLQHFNIIHLPWPF